MILVTKYYRGSSGKAPGGGVFFYASLISDRDLNFPKNIIWYSKKFLNITPIKLCFGYLPI